VRLGEVPREHVKALIDRLADEQVQALWIILESMVWPLEEISPEEAAELAEARAQIEAMHQTRIVPLDFRLSLAATETSIRWKLPLADAVVYATAQAHQAQVITSDSHFEGLPSVLFVSKGAS
jgi:predicted nucleic acid-binding protein